MADNEKVVLKPDGDIELWYAEADDRTWRLPLHVEWKVAPNGSRFALIVPALCFYQNQLMIMHGLLHSHSLEGALNRWLVPAGVVPAILFKAPGISAAFYYLWPSGDRPAIPSPNYPHLLRLPGIPAPARSERHRSFAEYIASERHIPADVVLMVLTAIGQLGARWLMSRNAIDLGFVKLVALPFRGNWKEIITFKGKPWKLLRILRNPKDVRDGALHQIGFEQMAASIHNTGLTYGDRRLEHTIEAITTPAFEKVADEFEGERMKEGKRSYIAQYEQAVEQLYDYVVEAMSVYAKKVCSTWAHVRERGRSGVLAFLPANRWSHKVRGVPLCDMPTHIVPPDSNFSVREDGESDPILVQAQAFEMQKVSDILQGSENMRECPVDGDMEQSRDSRTNGMPLLSPSQSSQQNS